jgi:hypothetical protein
MKGAGGPINRRKRACAMRRQHIGQAAFIALGYSFLRNKIGWPDDQA